MPPLPTTAKGTQWRFMQIGMTALLARRGTNTTNASPLQIPMSGLNPNKYGPGRTTGLGAFWRLGPNYDKHAAWDAEEPSYMKLRNYSYNVFNEDWVGVRPGEEPEARAARAIWSGRQAGSRMIDYIIDGLKRTVAGASSLMEHQRYAYADAGANQTISTATKIMQKSYLNFLRSRGTTRETIRRTKYWYPNRKTSVTMEYEGMGKSTLRYRSSTGGIPIINADSAEESKLFLATTFATNYDSKSEEVIDVPSAITQYQTAANKGGTGIRPSSQKADLVGGKTDQAFEKVLEVIDKQQIKNFEGNTIKMEEKISMIEVGMQPIRVRMAKEWAAFKKIEGKIEKNDFKRLEKFIDFATKDYTSGDSDDEYKGKGWLRNLGETRMKQARENKTSRVLGWNEGEEDHREAPMIVTQPIRGGGRILIQVQKVGKEIVWGPIGYIHTFKGDMGDAVMRHIMTDAAYAKRAIAKTDKMSINEHWSFDNYKMSVSHNFYGKKANLLHDSPQFLMSFAVPPKLSKALYKEYTDTFQQWGVMHLDTLLGTPANTNFLNWLKVWNMRTEQISHQIDENADSGKWKSWLLKFVRPKWSRGGSAGRRPKTSSGLTQPWEKAPRSWHPPLYVRPLILQNREKLAQVFAGELVQQTKMKK